MGDPAPRAALVWSVAGLLQAAGDALSARFGAVAVRGELSGITRAGSGHVYFTLKDGTGAAGALRCAMFRRAASLSNVPWQEGLQVELRGRLAVYEARGELQMVVEAIQRVGAGTLYEEFLRLKAKLDAEGLFDDRVKRALPPHPHTVGVVTSLAGAALHDVVSTLARRAPHVRVVVYPTLVQGPEAPAAIVAAIALAGRRAEVDVLVVCRGGGSLEDLWAFNDERVVRAIAGAACPVVSGVGHETDVTLADLAADLRAATPTAAAERVAPVRDTLLADLGALAQRMRRRVEHRLHTGAQQVDTLALRLLRPSQALARERQGLQALSARMEGAGRAQIARRGQALDGIAARVARGADRELAQAHQRLDAGARRLVRGADRGLAAARERLSSSGHRLAALDPHRVLERGFAWVQDAAGAPLTSAARLRTGDAVTAVFRDGDAALRVEQVRVDDTGAGAGATDAP
jgi:exodeoxyribonuclease VII large subunit